METYKGTSLAVQWLGLGAPNAGGRGSIPGWGTKILRAARCGQKQENMEAYKEDPRERCQCAPLYTSGVRGLDRTWLRSSPGQRHCQSPRPSEPASCPRCLLAGSPVSARAWPAQADPMYELGPWTALLLWSYPTQADTLSGGCPGGPLSRGVWWQILHGGVCFVISPRWQVGLAPGVHSACHQHPQALTILRA